MYTDTLTKVTPYSAVSETLTHTWGTCPSVTGTGSASVARDVSWSQSWKYGEATPNFHKRLRKGELLPFTFFEKVEREGQLTGGSIMRTKHKTYNICAQSSNLFPAWSTPSFDDLWTAFEPSLWNWDAYVQAAAAAIDSKAFDLLTFAAEIRELRKLYELVSGRFVKAQFAKAASRKNPLKRNQDISDTIVDSYLGARYGLRPLIADINNLSNALKDNLGELRRFKERRGVSDSWTTTNDLGQIGIGWGHPFTVGCEREITTRFSLRGSVICDIDLGTFKLNPLQTGWELLPYSFVVDWFVSVGKALGSLSLVLSAKGIAAARGLTTTFYVRTSTGTSLTNTNGGVTTITTYPSLPLMLEDTWVVERRVPTSVSLTPFVNVRLDPWKAFDLYALLDQLARKLR